MKVIIILIISPNLGSIKKQNISVYKHKTNSLSLQEPESNPEAFFADKSNYFILSTLQAFYHDLSEKAFCLILSQIKKKLKEYIWVIHQPEMLNAGIYNSFVFPQQCSMKSIPKNKKLIFSYLVIRWLTKPKFKPDLKWVNIINVGWWDQK